MQQQQYKKRAKQSSWEITAFNIFLFYPDEKTFSLVWMPSEAFQSLSGCHANEKKKKCRRENRYSYTPNADFIYFVWEAK